MWRDILLKLKDEGGVILPYDTSISTEIKCLIGDIPVYKFKVQYFKEGVDELITKYADTFEELERILYSEIGIEGCACCGHMILGGFFADEELGMKYCSAQCMVKSMNDHYGVGNWHFKSPYVSGLFSEEDGAINEYQFEVYVEKWVAETMDFNKGCDKCGCNTFPVSDNLKRYERIHIDGKELGEMWNDGSGQEPDEESLSDSEADVFNDFDFNDDIEFHEDKQGGGEPDDEPSGEETCEGEPDNEESDKMEKIWVPYHMYYCPPLYED